MPRPTTTLIALGTALASFGAIAAPPPSLMAPESAPAAPNAAATLNRLNFEVSGREFGRVLDNEPVKLTFPFNITGIHPLQIKRIKPACGCTLAEVVIFGTDAKGEPTETVINADDVSTHEFQPGDRGEFRLRFDPTGRFGEQHKSVTIWSTDTYKPTQVLRITGTVVPIVEVGPSRYVAFGEVEKGAGAVKDITVTGRTPDFEASKPTFSTPGLYTAEVLKTEDAEIDGEKVRQTTIRVTLRKDAKPGMQTARMIIRTNDDRKPVVETNVITRVLGDLEVNPPRLSYGRTSVEADPITRVLRVKNRKGKPFEIKGVRTAAPGANIEVTYAPANEDHTEWTITTVSDFDRPVLQLRGNLLIDTDMDDEAVVEVPLTGNVMDVKGVRPRNP